MKPRLKFRKPIEKVEIQTPKNPTPEFIFSKCVPIGDFFPTPPPVQTPSEVIIPISIVPNWRKIFFRFSNSCGFQKGMKIYPYVDIPHRIVSFLIDNEHQNTMLISSCVRNKNPKKYQQFHVSCTIKNGLDFLKLLNITSYQRAEGHLFYDDNGNVGVWMHLPKKDKG